MVHDKTPLVIAAGPGTGKTMTITGRMVHLIKEKKVKPDRILAVTFTNKAAEEMKIRLEKYLPKTESQPHVFTFHAFCMDLLLKGRPDHPPMILDETDRESVMADAVYLTQKKARKKENGHFLTTVAIDRIIMEAKQKNQQLEAITTGKGEETDLAVREVAKEYQNLLQLLGVCDYEDLIIEALKQLKVESGEGVLEKGVTVKRRFDYIFVDEYQDINEGQYRLLRTLVSPEGTGLCVIGDPDQAIYGFRGSDARFFKRFSSDFSKARQIDLTQNYRSTQKIVNAAVQMISLEPPENKDNQEALYSNIKGGEPLSLIYCHSEKAEAAAIGRRIVQWIGGRGYHDIDLKRTNNLADGMDLGFDDIAVVYRTRRQGEILSDIFNKMGVPVQTVVRQRQSHHKKVRQLISLLTIIEGRPLYKDIEIIRDVFDKPPTQKTIEAFKRWGLSHKRHPKDALDKARLIFIKTTSRSQQIRLEGMVRQIKTWQEAIKHQSVAEKITFFAKILSIDAACENDPDLEIVMKNMVDKAAGYGDNSRSWISSLAVETDTDAFLYQSQRVSLLTMHAAKGLEFPVVFIAGCEEGLIPFQRNGEKSDNPDEEKRLFYVAMTRAKQKLYLSWAKRRQVYGKRKERTVSPFIGNIDSALIDEEETTRRVTKPKPIQQSIFDI